MIGRRPKIENVVVAALLFSPCIPVPAQAASAPFFSGSLRGEVKNATGIAQLGATVILYNQYDRVDAGLVLGTRESAELRSRL
jgi:hypothetical protein